MVIIVLAPVSISPNPLVIEPAFKAPTAVICVCEASTFNAPLEPVSPVPPIAVAKSAIDSLRVPLLSSASMIAMLSLATFTAATERSLKFSARVTSGPVPFVTVSPPFVASATDLRSPSSSVTHARVPDASEVLSIWPDAPTAPGIVNVY